MNNAVRFHAWTPRLAAIRAFDPATAAVWAVIAVTTVMRFTVGSSRPLWLDETYTAMIAGQPTVWDFLKQSFNDTNAPLYYVVAALVAKVLGYSDFALRLPAAVFGALTPVAAMSSRLPGPRAVRYTWAVLLACWLPGLWFSQNARCYTLLLMLAVLNCSLFISALEDSSSRRFGRWAVVSSLMILTHYYAAPLVALQFCAFLPNWRRLLGQLWPAMLAFIPAAVAMAISASKFLLFTNDHVSWIHLVTSKNVLSLIGYPLGGFLMLVAVALWVFLCLLGSLLFTAARGPAKLRSAPRSVWIAAALSVACVSIALTVGAFKAVVYQNYLVSFAPGVLLGLSAVAGTALGPRSFACGFLNVIFLAMSFYWSAVAGIGVNNLNIEIASERLMAYHPQRLVFLWDSPFMLTLNRSSGSYRPLAGVGGFFFARAGKPVTVDAVDVRPGMDPNPLLMERAKPAGSVIIWVYDLSVAGTAAKQYLPRIPAIDPSWRCEGLGELDIHVLACHKAST